MRTDRYRQVAAQVHALLRSFAPDGQAEKTSYDDFYLDVSAACAAGGAPAQPPAGLLVLPRPSGQATAATDEAAQAAQQQWAALDPGLRRGVLLAAALRAAAKQQLGLTLSCGVARNKLLARLASPAAKPDGLAVVPHGAAALAFIRAVPLQKVPQLR